MIPQKLQKTRSRSNTQLILSLLTMLLVWVMFAIACPTVALVVLVFYMGAAIGLFYAVNSMAG
jgi:ABC-type transport system involved in multi-copper enzyme maturation permease subunit